MHGSLTTCILYFSTAPLLGSIRAHTGKFVRTLLPDPGAPRNGEPVGPRDPRGCDAAGYGLPHRGWDVRERGGAAAAGGRGGGGGRGGRGRGSGGPGRVRGTGEGARDDSTRVVTPALLENDPASPRGGDDPADDRPAAIPRWAFLRVGEALAQSGGNSDTLDPDVSYLDVDFDNDSPGRRDGDGRPPRPRSFFDPRAISDSHCSLEYSDLYEGNATLVMPALQRNTSEAASLAYSQSDGSLDNDGYVVMPCAPRVLVFFETTPSRARTP